jgi:hypothetical protein
MLASMHTTLLGFLFYNRFYFNDLCIYIIGVYWNPRNAFLLFLGYPWSYHGGNPLEWLCLVNRTTVEVEWLVPLTRFQDYAPYLVRVVGCKVDENLNLRSGGATRGKCRIPDGKGQSCLMLDSKLQGGSSRLCWLRTASVGSRWASIDYVLTHMGIMGFPQT